MKKNIIIFFIVLTTILFSFGCVNQIIDKPVGGNLDENGCLIGAGYSFDDNIGACVRQWELEDTDKELARIAINSIDVDSVPTIVSVSKESCENCFIVEIKPRVLSEKENILIKIQDFLVVENFTIKSNVFYEDFLVEFNSIEQRLYYNITLFAPRSCDSFEIVGEKILESYPVRIFVEINSLYSDMMCATVMTPIVIEGFVEIDHVPSDFTILLDGVEIISTKEISVVLDSGKERIVFCTIEQKQAQACTKEYMPVIGNNGVTYSNKCVACSSGEIEYYITGSQDWSNDFLEDNFVEEKFCPMIWDPVCGLDNITYSNSCFAEIEGVKVAYVGECKNNFDKPASSEKIVCTLEQKQAEICYMIYAPVCGNNGITYDNDCIACGSKEIEYYFMGEC